MVIWIIGKSGSGKSFYGKELIKLIKNKKKFFIDGDEIRESFFNNNLGFDIKSRRINAEFIVKLCGFLERKDFIVVCSILSIFPKIQKKNINYFKKYIQIYLKSKTSILKKKNNKKIYSIKKDVVGSDIKFPRPYKSHLILNNKFDKNFKLHMKKILKLIKDK